MLDVDFDDFEFSTERTAPRQWVAVAPAIAPRRPARRDPSHESSPHLWAVD